MTASWDREFTDQLQPRIEAFGARVEALNESLRASQTAEEQVKTEWAEAREIDTKVRVNARDASTRVETLLNELAEEILVKPEAITSVAKKLSAAEAESRLLERASQIAAKRRARAQRAAAENELSTLESQLDLVNAEHDLMFLRAMAGYLEVAKFGGPLPDLNVVAESGVLGAKTLEADAISRRITSARSALKENYPAGV